MRLTVERSMPAFSASAVWLSPRTARAPRRKGLGRRWAEYRCGIASFFGMDALDRAESEALSNGSVSAQTYASRVRAEVTAVVIDELFPAEVKRKVVWQAAWAGLEGRGGCPRVERSAVNRP